MSDLDTALAYTTYPQKEGTVYCSKKTGCYFVRPANSSYSFPVGTKEEAREILLHPENRRVTDAIIGQRFFDMRDPYLPE